MTSEAWGRVFLLKGAYNILTSVVLLVWADRLLPALGAPPGNPAYAQMFFLLALAFGLGYCLVGLDIDKNHGIVAIGIVGQLSVFAVLAWHYRSGSVNPMGLTPGIVDLVF